MKKICLIVLFFIALTLYAHPPPIPVKVRTDDSATEVEGVIEFVITNGDLTDNGSGSVSIDTSGGGASGGGTTDAGTTVHLTTSGDEFSVGGATLINGAKLSVDGDADQVQFSIQGHSTQTSNLVTIENSAGTDQFTLDNSGNGAFTGDVTVSDEAYGVGWNGVAEVPTKNAVYDKIETLASSPFDGSGDPIVLQTTTKDLNLGGAAFNSGKLEIVGDADQIQLSVVGNGTQTSSILEVLKSDWSQLMYLDNSGQLVVDSLTLLGTNIADIDTNGDAEFSKLRTRDVLQVGGHSTFGGSSYADGLIYLTDSDGASPYTITIRATNGGGTDHTLNLPNAQGGANTYLKNDGSGGLTWGTVAGGGDVTKVGTPVDDQIGVWTGDGTIEGDAQFIFNSVSKVMSVYGASIGTNEIRLSHDDTDGYIETKSGDIYIRPAGGSNADVYFGVSGSTNAVLTSDHNFIINFDADNNEPTTVFSIRNGLPGVSSSAQEVFRAQTDGWVRTGYGDSPLANLQVQQAFATTNTIENMLNIYRETTGTAGTNIGASMSFMVETAPANAEYLGRIIGYASDVTSTSEDGEFSFQTMTAGATASTKFRIGSVENESELPFQIDDSALIFETGGNDLSVTAPTVTTSRAVTFPDAAGEISLLGQTIDLTSEITGTLPVANGGTGATTLTDGGILLGSGTGAITALGVATNGQIPIGDGTTDPVLGTISGTSNEIDVTNGAGTITLAVSATLDLGANTSVEIPNGATPSLTAEGQIAYETDTESINVYDGADVRRIHTDKVIAQFVIDGGGSAITTGSKYGIRIPKDSIITAWYIYADQSGSIVLDVWKDVEANYPPTVADTIASTEKPTLSTAIKANDTSLTAMTTDWNAGDYVYINVDSITTCTWVKVDFYGYND